MHDVLDSVDGRTKFAVIFSSGVRGGRRRGAAYLARNGPDRTEHGWLYHAQSRATLTFAQAFDSLVDCRHGSGGAFLVSQSGAFGARVVSAAARFGLHLDGFIGSGNEAHLDACTLARGALAVAQPKVLMLYLEGGLRDAVTLEALLADARNAGVPVVCLLGGLSDAGGANAAASHTAAVSADAAVVDELFRAYGATLVRSDRDLILSALAYSVLGDGTGTPRRNRDGIGWRGRGGVGPAEHGGRDASCAVRAHPVRAGRAAARDRDDGKPGRCHRSDRR